MTKEEKRSIIVESLTLAINHAGLISSIVSVSMGIICISEARILNEPGYSKYYILFVPAMLTVACFIAILVYNYISVCQKEKEKEKNIEYIDSVFFYNNNVLIIPKYNEDYQSFFKTLSLVHDIKYLAKMNGEKMEVFMVIDGEEAIKFQEIDKKDFLEYYDLY